MQLMVSYVDQYYYENMSWINSNITTNTKAVHEAFHLNSKLEYFSPINLMITTVLMIISGSQILKVFHSMIIIGPGRTIITVSGLLHNSGR